MSEHAPGVHDSLSFEQYRLAAGVSRSMLLGIHPPSTPAHYRAKHIDRLVKDEDSSALRMGRFAHLMLTPDLLSELVVEPETTSEGKKWDNRLKECRAWQSEQTKDVISSQQWNDMHAMWESVRNHDLAGKLLRVSDCERSAFVQDPASGLMLKARFDGVPRGGNALWDLKTCEAADEDSASKFMAKWKCWYQAAFYLHVANLLGLERCHFFFVMVEKAPPYAVAVYEIDPYHLEAGSRIIRNDLMRLAQCIESNSWPGYSDGSQIVVLPKWEIESEGLEQVA